MPTGALGVGAGVGCPTIPRRDRLGGMSLVPSRRPYGYCMTYEQVLGRPSLSRR